MLNEVYNRRIIELAGTIPRIGRLHDADASATAHSKLCGSTVTIDLKMDGDTVTDFAHEVKACALGQASSSIMARNIVGAKADELRQLRETVRKMLKENGAPPQNGKWADIGVLEPVRDYKARHASTLLTFDAVVDAINQIEFADVHFLDVALHRRRIGIRRHLLHYDLLGGLRRRLGLIARGCFFFVASSRNERDKACDHDGRVTISHRSFSFAGDALADSNPLAVFVGTNGLK